MIVDPLYTEVNCRKSRRHDDRQYNRFPDVALTCIALLHLLPVVHLLAPLCRKCVDQDHQDNNTDDHVRAQTSLDAEACIIEDTVARGSCFELEDRVLGHNSAVGKAEHNTLGEIPCCVGPDRCPEAVPVVNEE